MLPIKYEINDIVTMKKKHPCGSADWKVLRVGQDFKLICMGCGREVMISRTQLQKSTKLVKHPDGE